MIHSPSVQGSPVARRLLYHLFSIGRGYLSSPRAFDPLAKPGVVILWVRSGRGWFWLDDAKWELTPGPTFWFFSTQSRRRFQPDHGQLLVIDALRFGGPCLESWLEELDAKRQPQIHVRHPSRIYRAYDEMRLLVRQRRPDWEAKVHLLLTLVLNEFLLARQLLNSTGNALPSSIKRALDAVEADPGRDWRPRELAALAGMNYTTFGSLFHRTMQQTPHDYLQRTRLDHARVLLTDPRLRIKEIARQLHFCSGHYFSRFFHQHAGMTPTEYRSHIGLRPAR